MELTDFSVHYSQGLVDAITAELKAGKSEVVCDAGQLAKFTKDEDGIVRRDILTKTIKVFDIFGNDTMTLAPITVRR